MVHQSGVDMDTAVCVVDRPSGVAIWLEAGTIVYAGFSGSRRVE